MADLTDILPYFDLTPWRHLTYSLEKKSISTAELISIDPVEIARKCPLPLKEVRRMAAAVVRALQADVGHMTMPPPPRPQVDGEGPPRKKARLAGTVSTKREVGYVSTLDERIDECLGGGFPTGTISEIVGESAVGKTQFVLSLLLAAQLPPPHGLTRGAIYLSTESSLNTIRLTQMIKSHPVYTALEPEYRPSLDSILTMDMHDMEKQEHIIQYRLEAAVKQYDLGLVVIDSIAANFRAEFQGASRKVLAERAIALSRLGATLRRIAHKYNVTVVVTNQVADRFDDERTLLEKDRFRTSQSQSSSSQATQRPAATTPGRANGATAAQTQAVNNAPPGTQQQGAPPSTAQRRRDEVMSLDFQQRFFTGWGDDVNASPFEQMKTPALGLTWANQIDARIVLKIGKETRPITSETGNIWSEAKRRRYLKVVFAPWVKSTRDGVEYELEMQGPVSIEPKGRRRTTDDDFDASDDVDEDNDEEGEGNGEHAELLDPKYWEGIEDEEFP